MDLLYTCSHIKISQLFPLAAFGLSTMLSFKTIADGHFKFKPERAIEWPRPFYNIYMRKLYENSFVFLIRGEFPGETWFIMRINL